MDLSSEISRIAREQGRESDAVTHEFERAIVEAAAEAWGRERELEGRFNAETNAVEIYQLVRVVEHVDPSRTTREMDLEIAGGLGGEPGDELGLQVFYRDEDGDQAVHTAQQGYAQSLPPLEILAAGLPFAGRPEWMRPLWPHRRMPWRFGRPVTLPALPEALDIIARFLDDAGAEVQRAGASPEQLEKARELGPLTGGLVALHERFGPGEGSDAEPLTWRGHALLSVDDALSRRDTMNEVMKILRADGAVDETWWNASWLPVFALDGASAHCLDPSTGAIVRWAKDVPERTVEAPSLDEWLGVIAIAAESGLLAWEPKGMGLHCNYHLDPRADQWFQDLQRLALPGFPRLAA
ncbi:SMI1/KNR4 family protein [Nannocystis sp. SCPEA4]|uniref:NusA N-terminal domain-containing protein n=1 Tax=Nannocystis sp. SCPEA4 TaxID=2996787 RepID=UPI002271590F|nr:SMI1/KNR4 family protein [Nannocystis sp. SCPEA4]MCY1057951.1 SMI1/KNR4 family protein [Nannocystis sp. SCPEA4]